MLTLQTILFTTDGSDCAEAARPVAERLARHAGATLHVLRVDIVPTTVTHVLRENAPDALLGTVTTPGETVEAVRRFPTADYAILDYAREIDADLVVMGTHGHSGLDRAVMGSTTEMILRRSPCPVLTVGPDASAEATGPVVVPVDFSSGSDIALETGAAFAAAWGVGLVALHVIEQLTFPVPYALTVAPFDRSGEVEAAQETLDRWAGAYASGAAPVTTEVVQGVVPTRVHALAESLGASLVVQASHGRRGPARWLLGSDAEAVVRTAPCPVLTLRADSRPLTVQDGEPVGVAVPRESWGAFFDAVSARASNVPHAVSVEVVSPGAAAALYDDVPLLGLTYDAREGTVEVMTEDGSHAIARPFSVRSTVDAWGGPDSDGPDSEPWRIDVVRGDGTRERITVHAVEVPVVA